MENINSYLSQKAIPVHERLIFALDVPSVREAKRLVDELGDSVTFYKIGLELFMAGGYFELIEWLKVKNKKIFVDLKFFDVPQTVASAIQQLIKYDVDFATVHGNDAILQAAANVIKENNSRLNLLAVTVLTSLDQGDIDDLGFSANVQDIVVSRAKRAVAVGCSGVISSGIEAPTLRASIGESFLVISPGIRPVKNTDDQKRTVDVEEAFHNGADYIVVGRPIKLPIDASQTPRDVALSIQLRISALFS